MSDHGLERTGSPYKPELQFDDLPEKVEIEAVANLAGIDLAWEPSEAQKRAVLRKIDTFLIPLMCGCVCCTYTRLTQCKCWTSMF